MAGLDRMLGVLWKRRWTFLVTFVLVVAGTIAITLMMPTVYRTSSYLLVSSAGQAASDFEATQTNQVLSKTYAELLQTRNIADVVAERLPWPTTGQALQNAVAIAPITQTQLIQISAEASSPERARIVANMYGEIFVERVDTLAPGALTAVNVALAEPAPLIDDPVRPRPLLYTAIGVLLGLFAAATTVLVRDRFDERLEIDAATTELLGLPIIGRIAQRPTPLLQALSRSAASDDETPPQLAEGFRLLLANLTFVNGGERPRSLAVVSASETEGKSTCCLSVGRAAQELGINVALVDGDMRRPGLTRMLVKDGQTGAGLSKFLLEGHAPSSSDLVLTASEQPLQLIPSGPLPPNPGALLGGKGLPELERRTKLVFDLVIFDTPPLLIGPDASLIAATTEGTIVVVDMTRTKRSAAVQAVEQLRRANANVLGIVLNKVPDAPDYYYHYGRRGQTDSIAGDGAPREPEPASGEIRI